jgi:hypothetical protein
MGQLYLYLTNGIRVKRSATVVPNHPVVCILKPYVDVRTHFVTVIFLNRRSTYSYFNENIQKRQNTRVSRSASKYPLSIKVTIDLKETIIDRLTLAAYIKLYHYRCSMGYARHHLQKFDLIQIVP